MSSSKLTNGGGRSRATSTSVIGCETEMEIHRIIYNWNINNFDQICTPETDKIKPISANPFRAGQEINRDSEWDLILRAEGGYLQIWLHLKKIFNEAIKDISVNLTVRILKADGTTLLQRRFNKNQTFTNEDSCWGMGHIITIETLWDEKEVCLTDNKLRFEIQLDVLGDLVSRAKTPGSGSLIHPPSPSSSRGKRKRNEVYTSQDLHDEEDPGCTHLSRDMKKLLKSQHDCDFTIECGQNAYPVHKIILSARSKVFSAMLNHDTVERRSNIVRITDISASALEKMMEYIYTGSVKLPADLEETMDLVEAGDKYQLDELKNRCLRALCTQITPENVGKIAILAYLHNAELVIQEEIHYCQSNWDSLVKKKSFKECLISTPKAFFDDIKSVTDSE